MELFPIHTRITNYNKLVDRFLTVQVRNSSDIKNGKIFALIEILNPWHPNAQIGQTIINTLSREYFRQTNTNKLIRFENALKRVNEKLVQITQNGESDWIGKTNAVLCLVANNEIHLSYTGKIHGYLFRDDQAMPVINSKEAYSYQHPLKTFSSVISGQLQINDRLFFSTNLLFDHLNTKNLTTLLKDKDQFQPVNQIANILKSRNLINVNCIYLQMCLSDDTNNTIPEVIYIDEQKFNYYLEQSKQFFNKLFKGSSQGGLWLKNQYSKSKTYYKDKIAPGAKKLFSSTKQFTKEKIKFSKTQINKSIASVKHTKDIKDTKISTDHPVLNIKHYNNNSATFSLWWKKFSNFCQKIFKTIINFIHKAFLPKNRARSYVVIAVILIVILITNIGYLKKINYTKENQTQIDNVLTELEIKKGDASLAILTGDNQKASDLLNEILESLKQYENDKQFEDRINALKTDINKLFDKISGVNRLTDNIQIAEFNEKVNKFYMFGNIVYGLTENSNQILKAIIDPKDKPQEVARLSSSDGTILSSIKYNNDIYIYTSKQFIFKFSDNKLSQITSNSGSWPNAQNISLYLANIYLLDNNLGQIYKSVESSGNYENATDYLDRSQIDITKAVSFSIDGSIYVLKQDGTVVKLTLGQQSKFDITDTPNNFKIENPKKIFTSEDISSVYILDANRVIELDKEGKYINQFNFSQEMNNITDFEIYPKTKELYIINSGLLYKYNIQ